MKKRPDAENFLEKCRDFCIVLGLIGIVPGVFVCYSGESVGLAAIGCGAALLLCAVMISICIRFHNVLLDIRDVEYETLRLMKLMQYQLSQNNYEGSTDDESVSPTPSEDDELQQWKDSVILRARKALEEGKISEESYISFVNKVTMSEKIPENPPTIPQ